MLSRFFDRIRTVILWFTCVFLFLLVALPCLPFVLFRPTRLIHRVVHLWCWIANRINRVQIRVHNAERWTTATNPVILSNHASLYDMLVMYHVVPVQFRWLAKASLFRIPLWGWGMWAAGYIPVQREDRKKSSGSMYEAARRIKGGVGVVVYPEGRRGPGNQDMLPFKRGGFLLARLAEVPVQPITIVGSQRIIPKEGWLPPIRSGSIDVYVHDEIPWEEYNDWEDSVFMNRVRTIIAGPLITRH